MPEENNSVEQEMAPEETPAKKPSALSSLLEIVIIVVAAIAIAFVFKTFIAEFYEIPSGSMLETIQLQDRVVSEKVSYYFGEPKVGDIVTFISPEDGETTLIKRVVATAGQTIMLHDGTVYIDGEAEENDHIRISDLTGEPEKSYGESFLADDVEYTIPDGCVWCMGDNREDSADSRSFGPVPISNITGHACFIYWPFADFGVLE